MLRRLLLALALVGVGVAFGAPGDPRYVPTSCADTHFDVFLSWLGGDERTDDGDPDGNGFTYVCNVSGTEYVMDVFHLAAAVSEMGAWADYRLNRVEQPGTIWYSEETPASKHYQLTFFAGGYPQPGGGIKYIYQGLMPSGTENGSLEIVAQDRESADAVAAVQYEELLDGAGALDLDTALVVAPTVVSLSIFKGELALALYGGLMDEGNLPPGVGGGEDPGGSGGGDPNDPYRPSGQVGRCGQGEGLSWFEAAISRMFQPCEDWAGRWLGLTDDAAGRVPFGVASWFPYLGTAGSASSFSGDRLMIGCRQVALVNASVYSCVQPIEILGHQVPYIRLSDIPGFQWWHDVGRGWLFYVVVAGFAWMLLKMVLR